MASLPKVLSEPYEVYARLTEIGRLTVEVLQEAAVQGEMARATATENHPVAAPGLLAYFDRVRALRDQLRLIGWTKRCQRGSELTISPDGSHVIVVASGDENTGSRDAEPRTKCAKGVRMEEAAAMNRQYDLWASIRVEDAMEVLRHRTSAVSTWVLLVGRHEDRLTVELSTPSALGEDGRASEWIERILLPDVPLFPTERRRPETGPDFTPDVTRKAAA